MRQLRSLCGGELPQAVFFDLDGTLLDSVADLAGAVDAMLEEAGAQPAGIDRVRSWVGNGSAMLVRRALNHSGLGADPFAHYHQRFFDHYERLCSNESRLYPGAAETVRALAARNIAVGCVTNKPTRFTMRLLEHYGLAPVMSVVLCGDTLAERKPAAAPLLEAASRTDTEPARCVMVGDSATDIDAARAAGMPAVLVTYGYRRGASVEELGADLAVDRLDALLR